MTESSLDGVLYQSIKREDTGPLPPLIEDARENALLIAHRPHGTIYMKNVAVPTVRNHVMVIPDNAAKIDMPGVNSVPDELLHDTFKFAGDIAIYYENNPQVEKVDVMINYSGEEPLKVIASQRRNLHVHILGYEPKDIKRPIQAAEVRKNNELLPQRIEPLHQVIHDLLEQQVVPAVAASEPFYELFERVADEKKAITYRVRAGIDIFSHPDLPRILKALHQKSQEVYNNVASCYFAYDDKTQLFEEGSDGRYKLLPIEERIKRVEEYIGNNPTLSAKSSRWLRFLATTAEELGDITKREVDKKGDEATSQETRSAINRFAAIKNLAYALVFSGIKKETGITWEFGFDPVVFSIRGGLQASRGGKQKYSQRDTTLAYSQETLSRIKNHERELANYLIGTTSNNQDFHYLAGPGIVNL